MAAPTLNFDICSASNCKSVNITPTTGVYDVSSNTGGWGFPNNAIGDAETATLLLQSQDPDTGALTNSPSGSISVFTGSPDVTTGVLPNITNTVQLVTAEEFGYGTDSKFADGIYQLTYTVTGIATPFTSSVTKTIFLYCQILCCFQEKAFATRNGRDRNSTEWGTFIELSRTVRAMQGAADSGDVNTFAEALEYAQKLCTGCGCGCN